jgi:hypothetical protein
MKSKFVIFVLVTLSIGRVGYSQPIGFLETECSVGPGQGYYYENYSIPPHGSGYKLYHNGNIILSNFCEMGDCYGTDLKFVDDTIGFFIDLQVVIYSVYKIQNNTVNKINGQIGWYPISFVINPYTIITASDSYGRLDIFKSSDVQSNKWLFSDSSYTQNLSVDDTIKGTPLCADLEELHYLYRHNDDTIIYTIILHVDEPAFGIETKTYSSFNVYPNPFFSSISIKPKKSAVTFSIKIYDVYGRLMQSIKEGEIIETDMDLSYLVNGIYFLEIVNENGKTIQKIVRK